MRRIELVAIEPISPYDLRADLKRDLRREHKGKGRGKKLAGTVLVSNMNMRCLAIILIVAIVPAVLSQDKPSGELKYDVKRCTAKVLSHKPLPRTKSKLVRKGEKPSGFSPIIALEILESGEVANAHVKRSSGFANLDAYALHWVQGTKYNRRPNCGVIETEAVVSVDF
jgi:TonB family protein